MKNIIRIGLVQMHSSDSVAKNLANASLHIKHCADKGAQIICLPELFLMNYFCQERDKKFFELAEPIPGPATDALGKLARNNNAVLITSVYEKDRRGKYFNTAVVIGDSGKLIGKYRKMHIPDDPANHYDEAHYFEEGDLGVRVIDTPYARIAPMVCFDQWFPEGARIAASKGAEILFYPTAIGWPMKEKSHLNKIEHEAWQVIQRGHAIANNVFVVAANRIGIEGHIKFWGTSFVCDPYGHIIKKASASREENMVIPCDLSLIASMRRNWPFLDARQIKTDS